MTLVEFFDKSPIENIVCALLGAPEQVILIGYNMSLMRLCAERYEAVLAGRGIHTLFDCRCVERSNLWKTVDLLTDIVTKYPDAEFDLTGGDETLLVAMGIVFERYRQNNIQMHRINIRTGTITDSDADGALTDFAEPNISLYENVSIHGGTVELNGEPALSEADKRDVFYMWHVLRGDPALWNAQVSALNRNSARFSGGVFPLLIRNGLLKVNDDGYPVYKSPLVKECLTKAGKVLELVIYLTALGLTDKGRPVYNDVRTSVVLRWNDSFNSPMNSDSRKKIFADNEVDVVLMHGLCPLFVSCKNGEFNTEELYKLNAVAEKFGGVYAKKALVATDLSGMGISADHLRLRASNMNIVLIENAHRMADTELSSSIMNLWR